MDRADDRNLPLSFVEKLVEEIAPADGCIHPALLGSLEMGIEAGPEVPEMDMGIDHFQHTVPSPLRASAHRREAGLRASELTKVRWEPRIA